MSHLISLLQSDPVRFRRRWRALQRARGVLADVAHHTDHAIRVAARTIILFSDDDHEALEARQLWLLVNATRPSSRANNHLSKGGTDVFRK